MPQGSHWRTRMCYASSLSRAFFFLKKKKSGEPRRLGLCCFSVLTPEWRQLRYAGAPTNTRRTFFTRRWCASAPLWPATLPVICAKLASVWRCQTTPRRSYMKTARGQCGRGRVPNKSIAKRRCLALMKLMYSSTFHAVLTHRWIIVWPHWIFHRTPSAVTFYAIFQSSLVPLGIRSFTLLSQPAAAAGITSITTIIINGTVSSHHHQHQHQQQLHQHRCVHQRQHESQTECSIFSQTNGPKLAGGKDEMSLDLTSFSPASSSPELKMVHSPVYAQVNTVTHARHSFTRTRKQHARGRSCPKSRETCWSGAFLGVASAVVVDTVMAT